MSGVTSASLGCGDDGDVTGGDAGAPVDAARADAASPDAAPVVPPAFTVTGKVDPGGAADATLVIAWPVAVPAVLPAQGQNGSPGFSVGLVAEFPAGTVIPDGIVDEAAFLTALGYSLRQGIVYRAAGVTEPAWLAAFPVGYSCGQCVSNGSTFDTYEPVACSEITLNHAVNGGCNYY